MDKTYVFYFLVLLIGMNFLVDFIDDINENDTSMLTKEEKELKKDKKYYKVDLVGEKILVFPSDMSFAKKKAIFKRSPVFKEILFEFPMFNEMIEIAKEKIIDQKLKIELVHKITDLEDRYLSGEINQMQVKEAMYNY